MAKHDGDAAPIDLVPLDRTLKTARGLTLRGNLEGAAGRPVRCLGHLTAGACLAREALVLFDGN
jgi:hypothetical protein